MGTVLLEQTEGVGTLVDCKMGGVKASLVQVGEMEGVWCRRGMCVHGCQDLGMDQW